MTKMHFIDDTIKTISQEFHNKIKKICRQKLKKFFCLPTKINIKGHYNSKCIYDEIFIKN